MCLGDKWHLLGGPSEVHDTLKNLNLSEHHHHQTLSQSEVITEHEMLFDPILLARLSGYDTWPNSLSQRVCRDPLCLACSLKPEAASHTWCETCWAVSNFPTLRSQAHSEWTWDIIAVCFKSRPWSLPLKTIMIQSVIWGSAHIRGWGTWAGSSWTVSTDKVIYQELGGAAVVGGKEFSIRCGVWKGDLIFAQVWTIDEIIPTMWYRNGYWRKIYVFYCHRDCLIDCDCFQDTFSDFTDYHSFSFILT